ncbi:three-Cys-motif partner protein TcmP [Pseudomonas sp. MWU13-2105]|uniref:three-Cys-motif partner protein TcmP n=1 Tax=Pseudomonas sp. MWU13-2105 TaxID=2935074 RepID=UPI00200DC13D|nr:three-Cys-motif partner protein TcmP [Pseudomonas sp. MWU13-2105]
MAEKRYEWLSGAVLDDHSRRKHKILREYFFQYLTVRCQLPQQSKFRLAVVDGFSGGGRYQCGSAGSPVIFIEELKRALNSININRAIQGLGLVTIECLLILNDADKNVTEYLKENLAPLLAEILACDVQLQINVEYFSEPFEQVYPKVKGLLSKYRYRNVLFNLDQCGHSHVERKTILDITRSNPSAEIFYTFAIEALVSFLRKSEPVLVSNQLSAVGLGMDDLKALEGQMNKNSWLGTAERLVFQAFKECAPYVSPFSINNPLGWRYWLIHFATSYKARQVYNNILHDNSSAQAHFGRSGLNMLSYDPAEDGSLYLFGESDRENARNELLEDIPRLISESGDTVIVSDFYASIYNETPAHSDDVHSAIIESSEIEVHTSSGGTRRKANTITANDTLKFKSQRSFFPLFLSVNKK